MSFPFRDSFPVDTAQRRQHFQESTKIESFLEYTQGKTLEQLRMEKSNPLQVGPFTSEVGLGPENYRYVQDPTDPGGVIDMRHFLESARFPLGMGEGLGLVVEID